MAADIRAIIAAAMKVRDEGEKLAKLQDRRSTLQAELATVDAEIAALEPKVQTELTQLRSVLNQR